MDAPNVDAPNALKREKSIVSSVEYTGIDVCKTMAGLTVTKHNRLRSVGGQRERATHYLRI